MNKPEGYYPRDVTKESLMMTIAGAEQQILLAILLRKPPNDGIRRSIDAIYHSLETSSSQELN